MTTLQNPTSREIVKMGRKEMNAHTEKLKKAVIENGIIIEGKLSEEQNDLLSLVDNWFDGMESLKKLFFEDCAAEVKKNKIESLSNQIKTSVEAGCKLAVKNELLINALKQISNGIGRGESQGNLQEICMNAIKNNQ